MAAEDSNLGACPACSAALVRNRQSSGKTATVQAVAPPPGAYFSELSFALRVVWCPACGWVKSVESPDVGFTWTNDEYDRRAS